MNSKKNRCLEAILYPFIGGCVGFLIGGLGVLLIFISFYPHLEYTHVFIVFLTSMIGVLLGYTIGLLFFVKNQYALSGFLGSFFGLLVATWIVFEVEILFLSQIIFLLLSFSVIGFIVSYYIKISINSILE